MQVANLPENLTQFSQNADYEPTGKFDSFHNIRIMNLPDDLITVFTVSGW